MSAWRYQLFDVFTDRQFGGNPLAVFPDGSGLSDADMQKIARELNLVETTFVLPPKDPANDHWVRIFTPAVELPMAGHPTVGTAFALARSAAQPISRLRFEEAVGVIEVDIEQTDSGPGRITMQQPLPEFGPHYADRDAIAALLSLEPTDLMPDHPCEVVSTGVPFLLVPVATLAATQRITLRMDLFNQFAEAFEVPHLYTFTMETEQTDTDVHSRMFAPTLGVMEDPATGGASGPLGCYLVKHGLVPRSDTVRLVNEQGLEMGRPSFIHIGIDQRDGVIERVLVGGQTVFLGEGTLCLGD